MVNEIEKFLRKKILKEKIKLLSIMKMIYDGRLETLDVKGIAGHPGYFRVKVGNARIIFLKDQDNVTILHVRNRDDQTYRNL